ncbi:G-box-binding factor 4-like isoform X2 [Mangifera indica]|uniref:G-box-binding factor 4-like isoform X2 n=1 Tax=Mangifera indica TaxID=29780 RepID=UPI001CFB8EA3|nr:G-box-binding factor 4-like isoform X2 [Mangifera indica]
MASSKLMKSSNSPNSDLSKRPSSSSVKLQTQQQQQQPQRQQTLASAMTVDGILRNVYNSTAVSTTTEATMIDARITLIETNDHNIDSKYGTNDQSEEQNSVVSMSLGKSVDDVWREIVSGEKNEMKEEAPNEIITLEDFLAKAGAVDDVDEKGGADVDLKLPITERLSGGVYAFDPVPSPSPFQVEDAIVGFGNGVEVIGSGGGMSGGRGKRRRVMLEPLDKAAQQRQRRMIKNRESAARSRERKQAYQVELESLAVRLEEENGRLLKEKAESTKERYKQLMEKVVPVVEKQRQPRILRRVLSMEWFHAEATVRKMEEQQQNLAAAALKVAICIKALAPYTHHYSLKVL